MKNGQILVESVIYTLIILTLIGTALFFVRPEIEKMQDRILIDKYLEMMGEMDSQILSILRGGTGNQRIIPIIIRRGQMIFDGEENEIVYKLEDSRYVYSEPGRVIQNGNVFVETIQHGRVNTITLTLRYEQNLTYNGFDVEQTITRAPTAYNVKFNNKGLNVSRLEGCVNNCTPPGNLICIDDCRKNNTINIDISLL